MNLFLEYFVFLFVGFMLGCFFDLTVFDFKFWAFVVPFIIAICMRDYALGQ